MKAQLSAAMALLLAGAAIATPVTPLQRRTRSLKNRHHKVTQTLPVKLVPHHGISNATDSGTEDSYNWGGIVASGSGITQVQSTITVPNVSLAPQDSSSDDWSGSAWVGIDGGSCSTGGLWQSGVAWEYYNGAWDYYTWYEWFPAAPVVLDVDVTPGDTITVQVASTSSTTGTYSLTNNNNGQTASGSASSSNSLCGITAEWIVENNSGPDGNGEDTQMPDFGSVQFSGASYSASGNTYGVSGGTEYIVDDNGNPSTSCTASGDSTINCNWVSDS